LDKPIRILIADDHPILRDGLRKLLEVEPDFIVAGEACNGHEALQMTRQLEPDMLLLDLVMPGVPCLEVLRSLTATPLPTRTILLTASIDRDEIVKALQLGARGIVMKDSASQLLMKAIRLVMAGQYWIGHEGVTGLIETFRTQMFDAMERPYGLTARELEIVTTVTTGFSNKEIAQRLSLSEETVKHHLTKIFSKLGVTNRLELALFAISQNLVKPLSETRTKDDSRD
jgi:two-component system, NarL family, nitrate/nitrite response regulator NarL